MATQAAEVSTGVMDRIRQVWCGLHGHDTLLQFAHDRMFLRCVSCGHETPGWDLNEAPPTVVARVEQPCAQPVQPVMRPHLISARRVA